MELTSLFFLYILLPLLLLIYFLMPTMPRKNAVLLGFSLLFYAMGQPIYLVFLVGLSYLNFIMARKIVVDEPATVLVPVVLNIALLLLLKYLDMIPAVLGLKLQEPLLTSGVSLLAGGLNRIGFDFTVPYSVVPAGISFYTLSVLSYLGDVYTGRVTAERSFQSSCGAPSSGMMRWPTSWRNGSTIPGRCLRGSSASSSVWPRRFCWRIAVPLIFIR